MKVIKLKDWDRVTKPFREAAKESGFTKIDLNRIIEKIRKDKRFQFNSKFNRIITKKILLEIIKVLNREAKFQKFIKNKKIVIEDLLRTILLMSKLIVSKSELDIVKEHFDDNRILDYADDGNVHYNNHLLDLKEYKNIKIISHTKFMKII